MNVAGIKLALSDTGGSAGRLRFPLIRSTKDWDILQERTLESLRGSGVEHCTELLTVLVAALDGSLNQERSTLLTILKAACHIVREKWDSNQTVLNASALRGYAAASERTSPMQPMPCLEATWQATLQSLRRQVEDVNSDFLFEYSALDEFLSIAEEITKSEPRFLRHVAFPEGLDEDFQGLLARVDQELASDRSYSSDEKDGYDSEADASFGLAKSLKNLEKLVPGIETAAAPRIASLTSNANSCRERYHEIDAAESERNDYLAMHEEHRVRSSEPFDLNAVFTDL